MKKQTKKVRSARTGKYVKPSLAKSAPDTTVVERVHKDTLRLDWVCRNYSLSRKSIDRAIEWLKENL